MSLCRNGLLTAAAAAALSLPGTAHAADIGIDWYGGSGGATPNDQTMMQPGEIAGVVPTSNWNSVTGLTGSSPLNLANGAASGATVSWSGSPNTWDTNISETLSSDHHMMLGYLDTNDTSITTIGVTGLPASVTTGGYKVIVYFDGDNGGEQRVGMYTVNGVSQWARDAENTNFAGAYTAAGTTVDPAPGLTGTQLDNMGPATLTVAAGNYIEFSGLTAADFTLTAQASLSEGGTNRAAIQGIQIIQVPEPAAAGLLAVGMLGLCARRRRRA